MIAQIKAYAYGAVGLALLALLVGFWYEHTRANVLAEDNAQLEADNKAKDGVIAATNEAALKLAAAKRKLEKERDGYKKKVQEALAGDEAAAEWAAAPLPDTIVGVLRHGTEAGANPATR